MGGCASQEKKGITKIQRTNKTGKCQLCHILLEPNELKIHLDLCHLATVYSQPSDGGIQVTCIVCKLQSPSLEQHHRHLTTQHKSMQKYKGNIYPGSKENNPKTYLSTWSKVKKIEKDGYSLEGSESVIEGQHYSVKVNEKQYGPLEYNLEKIEGDLIWQHVFEQDPKASYYDIKVCPQETNILVKGYVFTKVASA